MKPLYLLAVIGTIAMPTAVAFGHGTAIRVNVADGRLVVSNGVADANGFAAQMFVEADADGDPFGPVVNPVVGPVIAWQLPPYELRDMQVGSGLFLEAIPRPVKNSSPSQQLLLS